MVWKNYGRIFVESFEVKKVEVVDANVEEEDEKEMEKKKEEKKEEEEEKKEEDEEEDEKKWMEIERNNMETRITTSREDDIL